MLLRRYFPASQHFSMNNSSKTHIQKWPLWPKYITLPTKVRLVKAMDFPVVMYGCESWTIKKVECWIIDAFELWCWIRLLKIPWTARRSNQSVLKDISLECSLEGLMPNLKLQCFGHLMWRTDSLEKTLILGKIEGRRRRGRQRMNGWMASLTWWTWVWASSRSWWWTGKHGVLQSMGSQRGRHDWPTELNWMKPESHLVAFWPSNNGLKTTIMVSVQSNLSVRIICICTTPSQQ